MQSIGIAVSINPAINALIAALLLTSDVTGQIFWPSGPPLVYERTMLNAVN
jgi:hypothetical protein